MQINAATRLVATNLTELASVLRQRIKEAGIKAKVRVAPGGGQVQINTPTYERQFTDDEQEKLAHIAISMGFTFVRGMKIDPTQKTYPHGFHLYHE